MATILIVDDHSVHRNFLRALLGEAEHRLLDAVDGIEALQIAGAERPDLIITDIMMPRMDGYQFTMRLRADPALAGIPVIFYTSTYSTVQASAMAKFCNVLCVLQKPSPPQRIVAAVYGALGLAPPGGGSAGLAAPPVGRFDTTNQALQRAGAAMPAQSALEQAIGDYQSLGTRLTALIDMGIEIATERNATRLIENGCRIARQIGVAKFSVAAIPAPDGPGYTCFSTHGLTPEVQRQLEQAAPPAGLFATLHTQPRARRLQGLQCDIRATGLPQCHPVLDSLLAAPIATSDRHYGWIYLGDKLGAQCFSDIDEEVLLAVASQMAVAYENLLLFERLQASETQFRQLAENINEVFFLASPMNEQLHYVSPAYERIWGRSCASLYADPMSWIEAIHPDDRARIASAEQVRATAGDDPGFDNYYRVVQGDGAVRTIHARGFPIKNAAGQVYRIAGIAEDVTEYARAMQELEENVTEASRLREALQVREAGLLRAQALSKLGHVVTDADGSFVSWSDSLLQLLGIENGAMPQTTRAWLEIVHPADRAMFRNCCIAAGVSGKQHKVDYRLRRGDKRWIQVHQVLEPLPGPHTAEGKSRWFNTLQDVSEQTEQKNKLARISRILAVQSGINSAIVRIHEREPLLREARRVAVVDGAFSMAWVGLVGEPGADGRVIGWLDDLNDEASNQLVRDNADLGPAHPACRAARTMCPVICDDLLAEPELAAVGAMLAERGHLSLAALPLVAGGRSVAVIALFAGEPGFFDKEEQSLLAELAADLAFGLSSIEKSERLHFMAYYDVLTGLPNRSLFLDRLRQILIECEKGRTLACVVLLNIDRFGQINDAFGRSSGDAVLRTTAQRLAASIAHAHSIARVGGDLFALIFNDLAEGMGAAGLVESALLDPLEAPFAYDGRELVVSVRAGLALYPNDGYDAETLLKHAELAARKARSSAVRVQYFSAQMNSASAARAELESALRAALEERQFVIHYQPRVDLISGRIVSAEALVRWAHPRRGLVGPNQFIPLCEELGLIVPLGAWMIDEVCAQQAAWRKQGLDIVPVAVNLSALQFKNGRLIQTIAKARTEHGLEQKFLEFELTESVVMEDPEQAILDLRALKEIGAKLSLDDFGTGYSSLAYLQRFPFDFVKIDRSFVTNIASNPADAAIVTAVIAMAHSLRLAVVAEGVETEGQLRFLRRLGCDQLQGHYFSPAVDAQPFAAMLREEKCIVFADMPADREDTLLIVDDEPNNLAALNRMLRREGYRVLLAPGGREGLELLALNEVQVIIADQRMPGMSGTEFLSAVKELYPDTMRIVLSGYTDLEVVTRSVNLGAVFKFLTKPWDDDVLRAHIREAFRLYQPRMQELAK